MKQLHDDLFVVDAPQRFLGVEVGTRMTIVRLPDARLWLHSPIPVTDDVLRDVQAIGEVACLVAPNRFHHLYAAAWQDAAPGADLFVAPGLETKRSDLDVAGVLGEAPEPAWQGCLDQVVLSGLPALNEVVFFHRASATLVACDLAFNIGPGSPTSTRLFFKMSGAYGRLTPTWIERLMVRDRPTFRTALERMLDWPFERVVVSHGDVVEHGGREQIERSYAWLLGSGARRVADVASSAGGERSSVTSPATRGTP